MSRHKNTWLFTLFSKYTYRSSCASSSVLSILQMLTSILQILTHFGTCIWNSAKYGQWLRDKESTCGTEDTGVAVSIPGSRRSPGGRKGNPLQWDSWGIPWTEELGRLQTMRLQRVRHDRAYGTSLPLYPCVFQVSPLAIHYSHGHANRKIFTFLK